MKNVKKDALMASMEEFQSAELNNDATKKVIGGGYYTSGLCGCDGLDWVGPNPPDQNLSTEGSSLGGRN